MANEITLTALLSFAKGSYSDDMGEANDRVTMSGTHFHHTKQTIATSATALSVGSVATPGYFAAKNHDATNYVELRSGSSGADVVRLNPGEICVFRWAADATLYAIANTAAVELEFLLIEA